MTDIEENFLALIPDEIFIEKDLLYGYKAWVDKKALADKGYRQEKEVAKEILDRVDYESNGQTKQVTNLLRNKYGVEVEE